MSSSTVRAFSFEAAVRFVRRRVLLPPRRARVYCREKRTLFRRNHIEPPAIALTQLKRYAEAAMNAEELDELLGIEGNAARIYFANFTGLVTTDDFHSRRSGRRSHSARAKGFSARVRTAHGCASDAPLFGYRVNYRRVLEIQTRLLGRLLTGEANRYVGFETR